MAEINLYLGEMLMDMFSQMLSTIDRAMLSACTAEAEHQAGEATLYVALHMGIGQTIDTFEECEYLAVILQELYHRLVKSCHVLILFIATWVMGGTAVEDVAATVAAIVGRYAPFVRKTIDAYTQATLRLCAIVSLAFSGWDACLAF